MKPVRDVLIVGKSRRVVVAVLQAACSIEDVRCVVIGSDETYALRWSSLCARHVAIAFDGSDDERFVQIVRELAEDKPQAIMIPCDCEGIRMVNRVRDRLHLSVSPIPDTALLDRFDNKWQFHRFCSREQLPVPTTHYLASKYDANFDVLAASFGLPFMLKPVDQAGSLGVKVITGKAQFEAEVLDDPDYRFAPLIAQRFIDGEDIDLSLLSTHGELNAFAIQQVVGAEIRFTANAQLERLAKTLCKASGFHGLMHIDARIDKASGKVYLIESNPRFWASLPAAVWCGLNFVTACLHESQSEEVLCLVAGSACLRHPLWRPSCWRELLTGPGERARLLRAMTFDVPTLVELLREVPERCWRHGQKWIGNGKQAWHARQSVMLRARKTP
jgi:predicted ATP-grasp superfamily ATP-dependent carboligase